MFAIIPKESGFYELFERAARNIHEGASRLVEFFESPVNRAQTAGRIKDLEHAGDQITHDLVTLLNKTFITPLDREDIHGLASRLDDVIDLTDVAANRTILYKIDAPTEDARELARSLERSTSILVSAVPLLRDMRNGGKIIEKCIAVNTCENEADRIAQHALAALFEDGHDVREIIKWKDIYEDIEAATDRCEDVANILEGIVMKNAI